MIDLYNGNKICDFVFHDDFVKRLSEICNGTVSINLFEQYIGMEKIYDKYFDREFTKNILANQIVFYKRRDLNGEKKA